MKHSWQNIVDIIPVKILDDGIEVFMNFRRGIIYESINSWVLMLEVRPEMNMVEDKWLSISSLLLSSYGELGCGLSSFQNRWWLSCRYSEVRDVADITYAAALQLNLANFIETWPEMKQRRDSCIDASLAPVRKKWA